jgi:C4-dicarboxylate transporter
MPTLVNADAIYTAGAKPVYRSLPLVPPFRQGAAITAVIFTICAVFAAALGTSALRDIRGAVLAPDQDAPWSLSRA